MIYTLDEIKDGTGFDPAARFITEGAPLSERAPEVGQLLADLRAQEAGNDGGWPGGDTVSILCEWFTANGYDIDAPLAAGDDDDRECAECGDRVAYLSSRDWCDGCEADPPGCDGCGAEPGEERPAYVHRAGSGARRARHRRDRGEHAMSNVKQATLNQHVNAEAVGAYADRLGEWQTGDYHADSALATAAGKIRQALEAAMAAERQASDVLYERIYNRETSAAPQ